MWSAALTCCGLALYTVASISAGFLMGADWFEKAFREEYARRTGFIIGAHRRTNGEDKQLGLAQPCRSTLFMICKTKYVIMVEPIYVV